MSAKRNTVTIYVSPRDRETVEKAKRLAQKARRSFNVIVILALEEFVEKYGGIGE